MGQTADELTRGSGRSPASSGDVEYVETYESTTVYAEEEEGADTEEIRVEIEQTRVELSETIDAIQERLNPQVLKDQAMEQIAETKDHLVDQAKDAVREATIGRAEHMVRNASDTARETGFSLLDTITQNPIPAALVGIGLAWMFMGGKSGSSSGSSSQRGYLYPQEGTPFYRDSRGESYRGGDWRGQGYRGAESAWPEQGMGSSGSSVGRMAGQAQETAGQVMGQAQSMVGSAADTAQHVVGQAADTAQSAVGGIAGTAQSAVGDFADTAQGAPGQIERMVRDNPLGMGAIALGIGAAVGLAMPSTPIESQVMGQARDRVMDQAQEVVREAGQKVQRVAEEAGHAAQREAQAQKLPV